MPLVSRTRATLRSAELGFFGVWVNTRTQTPRFCGLSCSAGLLVLLSTRARPLRTSWLIVGTLTPPRGGAPARLTRATPGRVVTKKRTATDPRARPNATPAATGGWLAPGLEGAARATLGTRKQVDPIRVLSYGGGPGAARPG